MMHHDAPPSSSSASSAVVTPLTSAPLSTPGRMRGRTVLWVTLAVFAQESVWNFYDAQVPTQLRHYLTSAGLVGLFMGLDNVLGVFIQPWTGHLSDRHARGRRGRWPIILVGASLAAVPFALIPRAGSLPVLLACVAGFAAIANAFKGVTETLLPDYVAPGDRSKAQGFVKAGVSLTIVVSSLISLLVIDRSTTLAFAIPPLLMLVVLGLSWALLGRHHATAVLPDPAGVPGDAGSPAAGGEIPSPWAVVKDLVRAPTGPRALLMTGVFCFAGMWSALRSLLTPYGTEVLGLSRGEAGALALPGAVAFLCAVVPLAYVSGRLGQIRAIRYGVGLFVVGLLAGVPFPTPGVTVVSMVMATVGYAVFAVNALVALWNLAPDSRALGTYTGLYTVASASGMAFGPALLGVTVDLTDWRYMFLNAAVLGAVTFAVFTLLVRRNRAGAARAGAVPADPPG
ncbi:MFS transporter [Streptomyces sp. SID3212]|uniref:MFS transporter n=1 Tax=Streptomyces sp. SID3212 TaxID=2690259 RepID=UPI001EFF768D|nr:MFS transporter [Streptomyces sp. SID3212]